MKTMTWQHKGEAKKQADEARRKHWGEIAFRCLQAGAMRRALAKAKEQQAAKAA